VNVITVLWLLGVPHQTGKARRWWSWEYRRCGMA